MAYADIMAKSCHDEEDDDGEVKSFEEKEMEKQKLLYQQARLHDRGAAEMVLQTISASKGEMGPMVASTLKLGIAILNGGNSTVQQCTTAAGYSGTSRGLLLWDKPTCCQLRLPHQLLRRQVILSQYHMKMDPVPLFPL
ncbi:solute carrier family 15, member 5 [Sarotherodon galilaeus]